MESGEAQRNGVERACRRRQCGRALGSGGGRRRIAGGDALHTHSDNGENRAERAETDQDEYDGSCGNASDGKNKGEQ